MSETQTLSCGVVLARPTDAGWVTLMLRAYHHWDFPKGLREDGELPLEAALREVSEETGIEELSFDWGERYTETGPYSRGKTARYYVGKTSCEQVVTYRQSMVLYETQCAFLTSAQRAAILGGNLERLYPL